MTAHDMDRRPHPSTTALAVAVLALLSLQATTLWLMGHPLICKCGYVKLWHGVVNSSGNSQHLTDWYTPSHVIHGFIFYGLLHLALPRASFGTKLLLALGVEIAWEIFENSDFTIQRYRKNTIALDYYGDSIVNSLSDALAMTLGFSIARFTPVAVTVGIAIFFEAFTGWAIRDNLTLNVLMLLHPIDAIKIWQQGA